MFGQGNSYNSFHGSGKMYSPFSGYQEQIVANKPIIQQPPQAMKKRFNLVSAVLALFIPWTVFCLIVALWSFDFRYTHPSATVGITLAIAIPLLLVTTYKVIQAFRALVYSRYALVETGDRAAWTLFVLIMCCVMFISGFLLGNYNYQTNMRGVYDINAMSSYVGVNPSTMRGQELMDAGEVQFAEGTNLDLKYANGFKNTDVYCVAPITFKDGVLAAYDFWAVGKNCCSDDSSLTDFKCGEYQGTGLKGGLRMVEDSDRDFYRLAVQQAQSTYALKAIHPLFFAWTADPSELLASEERVGYQWVLAGILGAFAFQSVLVLIAMTCFAKIRFE